MTPPPYPEFLARLKGHERIEPFPSRRRAGKLAGIRALLDRLGQPERAFRIVHVAGTNGKGMTSAMIASLLRRSGARVGLYASPHVVDIRERIVLDGAWIAPEAFAASGGTVLDHAAALRGTVELSYFDLLTAIALAAFRAARVDWAVLETGLGGAADATNVAPKAVGVLTRIGWDHMAVLGDSLREIATEKLGILRPGVPAVIAAQEAELEPWLIAEAHRLGASPVSSHAVSIEQDAQGAARIAWEWSAPFTVEPPAGGLTAVKRECAATALAAFEAALGPLSPTRRPAFAAEALATRLPGRLEKRRRQPVPGLPGAEFETLVLDGAHNALALDALNGQLAAWGLREYTLIFGMQADKLVDEVRAPLRRLFSGARRIVTLAPQTARAPHPEALAGFIASILADSGRRAEPVVCPDAAAALREAARDALPVVATGSFWMLGDLMRLLDAEPSGESQAALSRVPTSGASR